MSVEPPGANPSKALARRPSARAPLPRMTSAEAVIHGVLKVVWTDGFEGVVDLRALIAKNRLFAPARDPAVFAALELESHGHSVHWTGPDGGTVDLGADSLRRDALAQARVHEMMTG